MKKIIKKKKKKIFSFFDYQKCEIKIFEEI
jgi:hypothetical protein